MSTNKHRFLASYGSSNHISSIIDSGNTELARHASYNPTLSSDNMVKLLDKKFPIDVRSNISTHENVDEPVLLTMATDPSNDIRSRAMNHPNATTSVLEKGIEDSSAFIRRSVIRNLKTPEHVLQKGLTDPDVQNAESAKNRLDNIEMKKQKTGGFNPETDPLLYKLFN